MCEEQNTNLQMVLHSLARRVPKIILQRVEEIYPTLNERLVSVLCLCVQKRMLSPYSLHSHGHRNYIFCDKLVLFFSAILNLFYAHIEPDL
jgi:hypothetical protein